MLNKDYIPTKPFADFKWRWASYAPTESINDPVVLLGVLFRMEKLEGRFKYSSPEFQAMLQSLQSDLSDSIGVNLASRGGERNIMRNSSQYWKALNLIPHDSKGLIALTNYGRKVARHELSQTEFSAVTIMTMQLPNPAIEDEKVCEEWKLHGIKLFPLRLILSICQYTEYLTPDELRKIVIPLSANPLCSIQDYVNFVKWYREGEVDISHWPDCCNGANDHRMVREFLLFLSNYGYMNMVRGETVKADRYYLNTAIYDEIMLIVNGISTTLSIDNAIKALQQSDITRMLNVNGYPQKHPGLGKHNFVGRCWVLVKDA